MSDFGSGSGRSEARHEDGKVRVTLLRSDPGAQSTFEVERIEPMMVLDLLLAVQREQDPSIGFRYSCRVAMCGTCTVRMDGRAILGCETRLEPDRNEVRLAPLGGFRWCAT
jgi:succinate dehydrogenase / fumarate reductase iron-sulfur subunit/fumarate reductase iron-sulfur subunit